MFLKWLNQILQLFNGEKIKQKTFFFLILTQQKCRNHRIYYRIVQ